MATRLEECKEEDYPNPIKQLRPKKFLIMLFLRFWFYFYVSWKQEPVDVLLKINARLDSGRTSDTALYDTGAVII